MNLTIHSPREALGKADRAFKPTRQQIDRFKAELLKLLDHSNPAETEEYHKNLIADFLKRTYFSPAFFINTKGRTDLVIHTGTDASHPVGVLIEAKRPANAHEMVRIDQLNTKAFQELVLYYMRERFNHNRRNLGIKNLVVTNGWQWFIFSAEVFEREFAQNSRFVQLYTDFEAGRLAGKTTDFFYKEIAAPAINAIEGDIRFTHFDMRDYHAAIRDDVSGKDDDLAVLYKLLSPASLLRLPFTNDSNTLNRGFYTELLHIIGLVETRQGSKPIISRKPVKDREPGSLIENTIEQLESLDKIQRITEPSRFGATGDERAFNVALQLSLTWVNRVLFLKLLEAQLTAYNRDPGGARFLGVEQVSSYEELNRLFFQVLARRPDERSSNIAAKYGHVPYLNSSLFEVTDLEQETVVISNLENRRLRTTTSTVLRDEVGRPISADLTALEYLLRFLDAYDFSSDADGEIREDSRTLITAPVLGLIFEKINGYKDGSFFTPGVVTMHMCRDVVRRAVLQRFNDLKGWNCETFGDLYDLIDDRAEANSIVNGIRICDPAVGSGHFLVSALNELMALKADLRILQDRAGRRLKEYSVEVIADELLITDEEGQPYRYQRDSPESQRVQEALFHEKQALIEGCLFGVDINPNSVNICRLRLWIELLKNAYFRPDGTLETLPNIDINIRCGNSLLSRFDLDAEIGGALKKKGLRISDYRSAITSYQNARTKDEKREMRSFIDELKGGIRNEILHNHPQARRLRKAKVDASFLRDQHRLFENEAERKARTAKLAKLELEIASIERLLEQIKTDRMLRDSFEWRFEYPEVLDEDGAFVGFDVVVGNPPYGVSITGDEREYLVRSIGKVPDYEIYYLFLNRGRQIVRPGGKLAYILPNSFLFNVNAADYRLSLLQSWHVDEVVDCTAVQIFDDAVVRNAILATTKAASAPAIGYKETAGAADLAELLARPIKYIPASRLQTNNVNWGLLFKLDEDVLDLVQRLRTFSRLEECFEVSQGYIPYRQKDLVVLHGKEEAAAIVKERKWHAQSAIDETYIEELWGRSLSRYSHTPTGSFVRYGRHVASYVDMRFFEQRRLLVREITNPRVMATLVEDTFVNDPQIISIIPKGDTPLDVLWAILNSRLASFYHFSASPKATKGLFPKILVIDVRAFPIPARIEGTESEAITRMVSDAFRLKAAENITELARVEGELEAAVNRLYGLSAKDVAIIDRELLGRI
ncbi:DUF7149 domain-containing protein [Sphingobium aromaticiconvertens]|uniref:DUF7149 domain-containing protein n=1 Tax=Sphingobium aromaticiconvertens TaxID=365341 RepID=UPI003017917B